jgi:hypothetical protein
MRAAQVVSGTPCGVLSAIPNAECVGCRGSSRQTVVDAHDGGKDG